MPASAGLRGALKEVAQRASGVARLQVELFKTEIADTGKNVGVGAGLVFGAAFIAVFAFGLLTTLFVVLLAIVLELWLSILIVLVVYLALAALLGLLARKHFTQAKGAPRAAEQARLTLGALGAKQSEDGASPTPTPAPQGPGGSTGATKPATPAVAPPTSAGGPDAG